MCISVSDVLSTRLESDNFELLEIIVISYTWQQIFQNTEKTEF